MTAIELRAGALEERPSGAGPAPRRPGRRGRRTGGRPLDGLAARAMIVGLAAGAIGYLGAGIPSYWGDEAASVLSAQRPWPSLALELSRVDAVHAAYYAVLHLWIEVFGASEWSTRALSSLAVGAMAAGLVVLGTRWFDARVGVVAGLIVALLPRVTSIAIETRGYALAAAAAVWLTVLFATLLRRRVVSRLAWVGYAAAVAACGALFLYLLLMPLVHAVALAVARPRPPATLVRRWLLSLGIAGVAVLPLVLVDESQKGQIAFLSHRDYLTPENLLGGQWFGGPLVAVPMWALIVIAVVAVGPGRTRLRALSPVLAWLAGPTAALVAVSIAVAPSYNPRYLAFSAPAAALAAAVGLCAIADRVAPRAAAAPRAVVAAGLVLLAVAAAPGYLAQRTPYAKDGGADFRQAAQFVGHEASAGDAVLFGPSGRPSRAPRLASRLYPAEFAGLADPQLAVPFTDRAALWDELAPIADTAPALDEPVVWLIERPAAKHVDGDLAELASAGYR